MLTETIDFNSPAFYADPYSVYARLRERPEPTYLAQENAWLFTRYEDVAAMLKDPRLTKQVSQPTMPIETSLLFQDPPKHHNLRKLVGQAFTSARVQTLESRIAQIADDLIDAVASHGQMDFIAQFALLLPARVMAEILGVPNAEQENFYHWSHKYITSAVGRATSESMRDQAAAMTVLSAMFSDLIERKRAQPQADVLSALTQAHDVEDRLTTQELIGTAMLLLIAGFETTVSLLGNGLLCLLNNPDQFALLKQRPDLMASAIEEMLRYESPTQRGTYRIVVEPITTGTSTIEPGAQIWAVIGAANRDPKEFPAPDRFDITRSPNRHLAFGYGIHYCVGAGLTRTEARIGFERVFSRLPNLGLIPEKPARVPKILLRGLKSVGLDRVLQQTPPLEWQPYLITRCLKALPVCW